MLVYEKYECFVMQLLYVCVSCAFCKTCSLLMLVEDARGDHMEGAYSHDCPTWVCRLTALRPGYVVKMRPDPGMSLNNALG